MSTLAIHHGLLGFIRLLTTAVAAGWVSSPMSWSPDARWLSYTVAPDPGPVERAPGWIFDASRGGSGNRDGRGDGDGRRHRPAPGLTGSGPASGMARRRC